MGTWEVRIELRVAAYSSVVPLINLWVSYGCTVYVKRIRRAAPGTVHTVEVQLTAPLNPQQWPNGPMAPHDGRTVGESK